jgi:hypothetical protein
MYADHGPLRAASQRTRKGKRVTAEIAILNREAVALAADSAVTIEGENGQKIFTTANKLFALSKSRPVGAMFYNAATICDLPWETVFKLYREQLGTGSFATFDEYVAGFVAFLQSQRARFFPAEAQASHALSAVHAFLHYIKDEIDEEVERRVQASGPVTSTDIDGIAKNAILQAHSTVMAGTRIPGIPAGHAAQLRARYGAELDQHIDTVLRGYTIDRQTRRQLRQTLINLFIRRIDEFDSPFETGVAFAGFGEADVFPRLRQWMFDGVAADRVKAYEVDRLDIAQQGLGAVVVPLAQREMVFRFMEGVDPEYERVVEQVMEQIIAELPGVLLAGLPGATKAQRERLLARVAKAKDPVMETIRQQLHQVRTENFADPVAQLVNLLPREELASMAEALVNLTSFKRRISWDAETVGGPIDVAVISKGDGFIWIKRKHYFAPELNPGFMVNRYGGR